METWKILIFLIALVVIFGLFWYSYRAPGKISAITDKGEYKLNDNLKLMIKNGSTKKICFSSCYPYHLERKKDHQWENYKYVECYDFDSNGNCIEARKEKAFELAIPKVPTGSHRLAFPICIDCGSTEEFREDQRFYSNEFVIQ